MIRLTVAIANECPLNYDGRCQHPEAEDANVLQDYDDCINVEAPPECPLRNEPLQVALQ